MKETIHAQHRGFKQDISNAATRLQSAAPSHGNLQVAIMTTRDLTSNLSY